jgi:hypothetical protein
MSRMHLGVVSLMATSVCANMASRNIAMHRHQRLSVSSPLDYDENTIPRSVLEQTGKTGQCPGPAEGTAEEEEVVKVEKL